MIAESETETEHELCHHRPGIITWRRERAVELIPARNRCYQAISSESFGDIAWETSRVSFWPRTRVRIYLTHSDGKKVCIGLSYNTDPPSSN